MASKSAFSYMPSAKCWTAGVIQKGSTSIFLEWVADHVPKQIRLVPHLGLCCSRGDGWCEDRLGGLPGSVVLRSSGCRLHCRLAWAAFQESINLILIEPGACREHCICRSSFYVAVDRWFPQEFA